MRHHPFQPASLLRSSMAAIALVAGAVLTAHADEWKFAYATEDWGPTCFVSVRTVFLEVGFIARPGDGDFTAYVSGPDLAPAQLAAFQVDNYPAVEIRGQVSDYFGWHNFDAPKALFDQIAAGSFLSIAVPHSGAIIVPLQGSAAAMGEFVRCTGVGLRIPSGDIPAATAASQGSSVATIGTATPQAIVPLISTTAVSTAATKPRAVVQAGAAYLPDRQMSWMPLLEQAIDLVATTHPGCVSIDNASSSPSRTTPGTPVFFVSCAMEGHILPFQNVFVRDGKIYDTSK